MIFVGVDWAETHHDLCVMGEDGRVLDKRRVPDTASGIAQLHELIGAHVEEPEEVTVGDGRYAISHPAKDGPAGD